MAKKVNMKMDKFQTEKRRKLIEDYVNGKLQVGQLVDIDAKYLNASYTRGDNDVTVTKIFPDGKFEVRNTSYHESEYYGKPTIIDPNTVPFEKDPLFIGVNPFVAKNWMQCCRHTGLGLGHIVFKIEEMLENGNVATEFDGVKSLEYNFNPYVYDKNGKKLYFQRDYCWTLEDEQNFIESIYNYLNLGTIVLRKRSFQWIEKQCKAGNTEAAFYDIIDGKQRIHTLMRFMNNEFSDLHGNYYGDFSEYARRVFSMDVQGLDVMEINEGATDEDVLRVFLNVNYSGKPMSREHLDYVKSLYDTVK